MFNTTIIPENSISVSTPTGVATSRTSEAGTIHIDPLTSEYIYQYSGTDEVAILADISNSGKTFFIKELANIPNSKRSDLQNKNIFVLDSFEDNGNKKLYSITGSVNNQSILTNIDKQPYKELMVVKPTYLPRGISDADIVGTDNDLSIVTLNKNSFDHYRFLPLTNGTRASSFTNSGISIKILDNNGNQIGSNTATIGAMTNDGTISSAIGDINTPHKVQESIISSGSSSANLSSYQTTNFDIYADVGSSINVTSRANLNLDFLINNEATSGNKKNFAQPKYAPKDLVPDTHKKFYNSEMGIIRAEGELPIADLDRTSKSPKLQVEPKYHFNKTTITEEQGEIKTTNIEGATKVFSSIDDGTNISRGAPFNETDTATSPDTTMLKSESPGLINRNSYIARIGMKYAANKVSVKNTSGSNVLLNTNELGKDMGCGSLSVLNSSKKTWPSNISYTIPLQFMPEITGESRSANWVGSTTLGKTNEYFMWATTASRTISFRTAYAVIAPEDSNTEPWLKDKANAGSANIKINPLYDNNWGKYWTETRISEILKLYRKLVIPSSFDADTSISDGNRVAPPVITINIGESLNLKWSNSLSGDQQTKSRWIITDLNIDTRQEAGLTKDRNPRMYEISLTLKEQPISWSSRQLHSQITR